MLKNSYKTHKNFLSSQKPNKLIKNKTKYIFIDTQGNMKHLFWGQPVYW